MSLRKLFLTAMLTFAAVNHMAQAEGILNGLFSNGIEGWSSVGDVTGVSTNGFTYVRMEESFVLRNANGDDTTEFDRARPRASRSRLFQEFVVPVGAPCAYALPPW